MEQASCRPSGTSSSSGSSATAAAPGGADPTPAGGRRPLWPTGIPPGPGQARAGSGTCRCPHPCSAGWSGSSTAGRRTGPPTGSSSALRRSPRSGEYEPLTSNGVYQVVKDAVSRAGIKKRVHPHLLRHSWMTEMLRHGMSPIQLSIIAGSVGPGDLGALHPPDQGRRVRRHAPRPSCPATGPFAAMRSG